jgi:hypothetical protein
LPHDVASNGPPYLTGAGPLVMTGTTALLLVGLALPAVVGDHAADAIPVAPVAAPPGGTALVELFTSEGCSSCPPADELLERLVREADGSGRRVYGLSFHVDYWDRLGWRDPFSSAASTHRQEAYARRFELASLYTPQMIVNGAREFVGSRASVARAEIDASLSRPSDVTPRVSVTASGPEIRVRCAVPRSPRGSTLSVAWVQSRAVSSPDRGENGGRTLRHVNVVRDFQTVELRPGFDEVIRLKRRGVRDGEVIAWVQEANIGRVLGATAHPLRGAP